MFPIKALRKRFSWCISRSVSIHFHALSLHRHHRPHYIIVPSVISNHVFTMSPPGVRLITNFYPFFKSIPLWHHKGWCPARCIDQLQPNQLAHHWCHAHLWFAERCVANQFVQPQQQDFTCLRVEEEREWHLSNLGLHKAYCAHG